MSDERVETITVPIAEEELRVGKREVETGRVRVRTVVDERQEMVREELSRSQVDVERIKVNVEVDEMPEPWLDGDTLVIPVVEEVVLVRKAFFVTEEVRLHRSSSSEMEEQSVTVRSQRAVVERNDASGENQSAPKE